MGGDLGFVVVMFSFFFCFLGVLGVLASLLAAGENICGRCAKMGSRNIVRKRVQ